MEPRTLQTPLTPDLVDSLAVGEEVRLTGVIYTARDQAHKRLCALLAEGQPLPIDLKGAVIYFADSRSV